MINQNRRFFLRSALASAGCLVAPYSLAAPLNLETALAPRFIGAEDAPIKVAEYFSLSCGHCADFHKNTYPDLKTNWIDTGQIQFEYRDFPLAGPAIYAHALARIIPPASYASMIDLLLAEQQRWVSSSSPVVELQRIGQIVGVSETDFLAAIENRPFLEGIITIARQGYDRYRINSTPSFVINDETIIRGAIGYDEFVGHLDAFAT